MAFTEFYIQTTGDDLNSGSTTSDSSSVTTTNGDWNQTTGNRFIAASGTPFSGVSAGEWASIYLDGATVTTMIGRVTAVNGGGASIDISTTARSGTTTAGATGRTCKIGGAWATLKTPLGFITGSATNSSGDITRINVKSGSTYNITSSTAITYNQTGVVYLQGYTTTVGDGGRPTIDGGSSGASYIVFTVGSSATHFVMKDLIFSNNGATGSARIVSFTSGAVRLIVDGCTATGGRGSGFFTASAQSVYVECEAYANNASNTANDGGFSASALVTYSRCLSYSNTGNVNNGFAVSGNTIFIDCIASSNGQHGFFTTSGSTLFTFTNCTSHGNTSNGFNFNLIACITVENCLSINNTGYGMSSGVTTGFGIIRNCAFYNNTAGTTNQLGNFQVSGTVTLTNNDLIAPASGNFTPLNAALINGGRGHFTNSSLTTTPLSYPNIGAIESLNQVIVSPPRRIV
jgi:hypothetical protein